MKNLGNTRFKISAIGLGTGDYFWDSSLNNSKKIDLIRLALNSGINFLDTAEDYGNGASEKIVGEAIKDLRDRVFIASKFSPQYHSYNDVITSCERSLKRLKCDFIDIYQIHWPNPAVPIKETIRAMKKLHKDGKIRFIGISNYSIKEVKEIVKYLEDIPLTSIQMEYNLFERTIENNGILHYCEENNISIMAYSPLDQGQMFAISPSRKTILYEIGKKYNKSIYQVILNFLIDRSSVVSIVRTTSKVHLLQNIQAMKFKLSEDDIKLIKNTFPIEYYKVLISKIKVSDSGEWNHKVYKTLDQAIKNKLGFTPSPIDLAKSIKKNNYLKPIRLMRSTDINEDHEFELVGGRIRYWAWVIAHGSNCPRIPAYIRNDYSKR